MSVRNNQLNMQNVKFISLNHVFVSKVILKNIGCVVGEENLFIHWNTYKWDDASSNYSALVQNNEQNISQFKAAWIYINNKTTENGLSTIETNPIVIDGIMYGDTCFSQVFSIDAETGKENMKNALFEVETGGTHVFIIGPVNEKIRNFDEGTGEILREISFINGQRVRN